MHRVSDDRLVKIPDLDIYMACAIGDRAEIAEMTIAANPDRWTLWKGAGHRGLRQPIVELDGVSTHISVRRPGHFKLLYVFQFSCALRWSDIFPQ